MTCKFGIGGALRLTCRCVRIFLQAFTRRHVPRATCHRSTPDRAGRPSSFRRSEASIGATPVPIGPAVRTLFPEMLGHTHTHSQTPAAQLFFADPPEEIFVHKNVLC